MPRLFRALELIGEPRRRALALNVLGLRPLRHVGPAELNFRTPKMMLSEHLALIEEQLPGAKGCEGLALVNIKWYCFKLWFIYRTFDDVLWKIAVKRRIFDDFSICVIAFHRRCGLRKRWRKLRGKERRQLMRRLLFEPLG